MYIQYAGTFYVLYLTPNKDLILNFTSNKAVAGHKLAFVHVGSFAISANMVSLLLILNFSSSLVSCNNKDTLLLSPETTVLPLKS